MKKMCLALIALATLVTTVYGAYGFLTGERISGMNKICYYDVLGSTKTLNVGISDLCPVSHDF
ncbi:MAG: Unknown protein [uncultured Sulfurovum sp.]|uniref:Uncharacterized protein n=1 Tax=uncultured Sulfurovum sp. TaxID=269237 RepID=A0A6S6SGK7_9BACT|nr:MAG: Unknown protein [uncultured Sulfurovum sp.]